jgi:hypothetical protein
LITRHSIHSLHKHIDTGPTHRHVVARSRECSRDGVDELAGDAKIAQLDDTLLREQNVRRLDIPVDDPAVVEVR